MTRFWNSRPRAIPVGSAALVVGLAMLGRGARAEGPPAPPSAEPAMSVGRAFGQRDGATLYAQVCAACHQAGGEGAVGAAAYPALAHNEKLGAAGYPVTVVLYGQGSMPALGRMMSDAQVADVVNYVRTQFGNHYDDAVSPADVKAPRP